MVCKWQEEAAAVSAGSKFTSVCIEENDKKPKEEEREVLKTGSILCNPTKIQSSLKWDSLHQQSIVSLMPGVFIVNLS